jgi:hypothetical protein
MDLLLVPAYAGFLSLLLAAPPLAQGERSRFRWEAAASSLALFAAALDLLEDAGTFRLLSGPSSRGIWAGVAALVACKWLLLVIVLVEVPRRFFSRLWHLKTSSKSDAHVAEPPRDPNVAAVVMVHGTFAAAKQDEGERWWQVTSAVRKWLDEALEGRAVCDQVFHWTGENKERSRRGAARKLLARIDGLGREKRDVHLIAHSHGGLVIWRALCLGRRKGMDLSHVRSWATVGTPFLHFAFDLASLNVVVVSVATALALVFMAQAVVTLSPHRTALATTGSYLYEAMLLAMIAVGGLTFAAFVGLLRTLGAGWSSWRDAIAQRDAWAEHGPKWLGLWSDDDEAIRGLMRSRDLESDWRAFLPLPAGADTLANELVWSTLRRFLQGNDLLARELVAVTTSPMGYGADNSLRRPATKHLLGLAESQGRNLSPVLRRAFADATATNASQGLHVLIERLGEAELTALLVHCGYFPTTKTMGGRGPRAVLTALYMHIKNAGAHAMPALPGVPPMAGLHAFVGPLAWRPALVALFAAVLLSLVAFGSSRFVAYPYGRDTVINDALVIVPAVRPEDFVRSPDVVERWLRSRIAHGADPSTYVPVAKGGAHLAAIGDALVEFRPFDAALFDRMTAPGGLDRVGLHYFVGRSLAKRGYLVGAGYLADSLPHNDAADLLLGVVGEVKPLTSTLQFEILTRSAKRVLPTEEDAAANRGLVERAKGRLALAILASAGGRADAAELIKEAEQAIAERDRGLRFHSNSEVSFYEETTKKYGPREGHIFRAWGRHHLNNSRYQAAWDRFQQAGTANGAQAECVEVVAQAARHGQLSWAMKQSELLALPSRIEAMTRVARDLYDAGDREAAKTLALETARTWTGQRSGPEDALNPHPVVPWTTLRSLLFLLGATDASFSWAELGGFDLLQENFFDYEPQERAKAVSFAADDMVRLETPERVAAFLESLRVWGDPSIAAAYGVVANRERAGEGQAIVKDPFGLRAGPGGGQAAVDAPAWMAARVLSTQESPEHPLVPPIDGLRPWARLKTVAEAQDILKDSSSHDDSLKRGFLVECVLARVVAQARVDKATARSALYSLADRIDDVTRGPLRQDVLALLCEAYIAVGHDRLAFETLLKCRPKDQVRLEPALLDPAGR